MVTVTLKYKVVGATSTSLSGKTFKIGWNNGSTSGNASFSSSSWEETTAGTWVTKSTSYVKVSAPSGNITLTANPPSGYTFNGWTNPAGTWGSNTNPVSITGLTGNMTVECVVTGTTYTISASAGSNGSISPSGNVSVASGDNKTFDITANSGYAIESLEVDYTVVADAGNKPSYSYTFSNVTANHTIAVTFKVRTSYTIAASAGSGGSISPSGNVSVWRADDQTFTITANSGYVINALNVDYTAVADAGNKTSYSYTFTDVRANHQIEVSFKSSSYTVRVYRSGWPYVGTYGAHNSTSSYIDVSGAAGERYDVCWSQWSGSDTKNICDYGSNTQYGGEDFDMITFGTTSSPVYPGKRYSALTYTITASAGTGGSISPSGSVSVAYGNNKTFTATPSSGYKFDHWVVDGSNGGSSLTYTFSNVTGNHTIQAVFATAQFTIAATASSGGTISPSGNVSVAYGEDKTFTMTANTGYMIESLEVDYTVVAAAGHKNTYSYTFEDVTADHIISVTFALKPVITASATEGGTIAPTGEVSVDYGGSQTFTATPNTGYRFDHWVVDGQDVPDND